MRKIFYQGRFIFIPLAVAAFLTVSGFAVMLLWNALIPAIFHLGVITFWQGLGLLVLCKILFGFSKGGRGFGRGGAPWMRHKMEERFKNMTPDEREKFKQQWSDKCGFGGRRGGHFGRQRWDDFAEAKEETAKPTE